MCTAIALQSGRGQNFLGRTLDFSHPIEPQIMIAPKGFLWKSALDGRIFKDSYGLIAMGQQEDGMLGFFDGVNENGFAAAALYFAGYAQYGGASGKSGKEQISSLEFLHFILGKCGSVEELKSLVPRISIAGLRDPVTGTAAPLHWIATDRSGKSVVVEPTEHGLKLYDNRIGVLANSPDFEWQTTNLRNYMNVSPEQKEAAAWGGVKLTPFGQAGGTALLPGGYASPGRFVRIAYQKSHVLLPENPDEMTAACFHLMDCVTIPKGSVVTATGAYDYTQYTAFINTDTCEYFFRAYGGSVIETAGLREHYFYGDRMVSLGPPVEQPVFLRR